MLFARINRTDPEKVFIVCKNGYSTAALSNGQAVMWDMGDADGVSVTKPSGTTKGHAFAGVVAETIAIAGYGLVQVYGYHSAVRVDCSTTAKNIYTGTPVYMRVNAFNLKGAPYTSGATAEVGIYTYNAPAAVALAAYTLVGTTGTIACIVHAL